MEKSIVVEEEVEDEDEEEIEKEIEKGAGVEGWNEIE